MADAKRSFSTQCTKAIDTHYALLSARGDVCLHAAYNRLLNQSAEWDDIQCGTMCSVCVGSVCPKDQEATKAGQRSKRGANGTCRVRGKPVLSDLICRKHLYVAVEQFFQLRSRPADREYGLLLDFVCATCGLDRDRCVARFVNRAICNGYLGSCAGPSSTAVDRVQVWRTQLWRDQPADSPFSDLPWAQVWC